VSSEGALHRYGERVHVLGGPLAHTLLARVGSPAASRAEVLAGVRALAEQLCVAAANTLLPTVEREVETRMATKHPRAGRWRGSTFDPASHAVVVDVIRGGIVPSQVCFELLSALLPEDHVRLDHLHMARTTAPDGGVTGATLFGSKIGGSVANRHLFVPDPMGATGSTATVALDHYVEHHGRPASVALIALICTPEFLRKVLAHPTAPHVFTVRVDRGLSAADVLATVPGTRWSEERGLDDDDYIVPGAGGVGEVLNNSWC
jgi:uracil phosphoribosyltransferase